MKGSFRQGHSLSMPTPAACLAGIGRVNFDERPASFFRFAGQLSKECRPRCVMNALCQTMVMHHPIYREVLYADDPMGIDDLTAFLVGEVTPSPRNPLVDTRYSFTVFATLRSTLRKFGVFALHLRQSLLFLTEKARVLYLSTIGKGSKRLESYVNTNLRRVLGQAFRVTFTTERSIPFACTAPTDGERFDLPPQRTMQHHLDMADTGSVELPLRVNPKARLRIGETIIAALPLKTREPRLLGMRSQTSEKGFEGQVNTHCHILQDLRMDSGEGRAFLFQDRKGSDLPIATEAFPSLLIGFFPFFQQVVIEPTALFERLTQQGFLFLRWVNPVLKHFMHIDIVAQNTAGVKREAAPPPGLVNYC